ncbi:magnesium/cobalt transporter CorA [Candidatus Woesearchaeota archaeon]|nr:magnesium/cobalt transporter CorA [Candidatus Woesearchaeota archaeon]
MIDIFYLDNEVLKKGKIEELAQLRRKRLWLDVINLTPEEAELLKKSFGLHPLTIEDLEHTLTRVKVEEFPTYLFCVFYGVRHIGTGQSELQEIDIVVGKNFIITSHRQELSATEELKVHPQKLSHHLEKGVDFLFHRILDHEIDNYFPVLEFIDEEMEKIDVLIKRPQPGLSLRIIKLKRNISDIRKTMISQREKISFLAKEEYNFISKKSIPYFRDVYDHSIRVADELEYYREAIVGTFEVYMSSVSLNTNEIMKVLSAITALAMPMTVISSIYGTNFSFLPGSKSAYGFWMMLVLTLIIMIGLLYLFKKRKWF